VTLVTLERLSISMEDGKVLRWLVSDGDAVESGEVIVEVETDKATIAVEAPGHGILRIIAREGSVVLVDGVLGELQGTDRAAAAAEPAGGPEGSEPAEAPGIAGSAGRSMGPVASPAARRLADELGVDLAAVKGSGPGGRIVARDLERETPSQGPPAQPSAAASAGLRQAVVRNIVASWQQIPHVQIGGELVADGLAAARSSLPASTAKVTLTDLVVFALARALGDVPELNGTLRPDGTIAHSEEVHLSLAVAASGGVIAPVLRDVGTRSLGDIAVERARLVTAAREGLIDRHELAGGTVTLSNLGAYPVDFFAPVISGPQIAMIATGRLAEKPVAEEGWIAVRSRMWVNVAVDHRAADGEAGARLLDALERQFASLPGAVS
jgi:pyruvate dehydrogenase E2 component (dihydrolipoamide acetyltransferase)